MIAALTAAQKEVLDLFVSGAYKLEKLAGYLTEEQLDKSLNPGEWSIRQITHHMSDDGDTWSLVTKKALAVPGTPVVFGGFPGNEPWADALAHDKRPIPGALALVKAHRHIIAELAVCFPERWDNCVTFAMPDSKEPGKIAFGQIIKMLTDHLSEHIVTIEAIKLKHGI